VSEWPKEDEAITDIPDADKYFENPFFFCYQPENLYRLVRELDMQSGTDIWDPSRHRSWTAAVELTATVFLVFVTESYTLLQLY